MYRKLLTMMLVLLFSFNLSLPFTPFTALASGTGDSANTLSLGRILQKKGLPADGNFAVVVDKSDHTLSVFQNWVWLKTYHVELGDGGSSDKVKAGDHKTPEGTFYITEKSILSPADYYLGTRWMRLSYPNMEDAARGLNSGLISRTIYNQINAAISAGRTPPQRTALGGGVGIHGGSIPGFGSDWTFGCVGLSNAAVEEIYPYLQVGTPIYIQK